MPHRMHPPQQDCEVCQRRRRRMRDGYRDRVRAGLAPDDPRHGTANGYLNYGCRCDACKDAGAAYNSADARRQRRSGHRELSHPSPSPREERRAAS